jgi:hypothetical protein
MGILFGSFFHRIFCLLNSIELSIPELTADFLNGGFRRTSTLRPCESLGRQCLLGHSPEPVLGLAEGETRGRMMTAARDSS